jgi:Protein of unknown function (DUF5132)
MEIDTARLTRSTLGFAAASIAGMLIAPVMPPALARVARPAVKGVVKAGFIMVSRGREVVAELTEMAEDMTAEIQAELAAEAGHASAGAQPATPPEEAGKAPAE